MLAPNSALGANDGDDEIPLQSLRTIIAAEKIVDEKRKEQEALAVEPSLGFNEEWCKANQDKTASSFKIRDLYGHMMPVQHGQPPIPVLTQFLSVVSNNNVYSMVKAAKGAKKEAKDADTWAKALTEINATILKNVCVLRGKKSKEFYVAKPIATSQNGYRLKEVVTTMLDEYEIQTDKNMRCVDKANASELFGFDPPMEVATTITSQLQSLSNARKDLNKTKAQTKEEQDAVEKKKEQMLQFCHQLVTLMMICAGYGERLPHPAVPLRPARRLRGLLRRRRLRLRTVPGPVPLGATVEALHALVGGVRVVLPLVVRPAAVIVPERAVVPPIAVALVGCLLLGAPVLVVGAPGRFAQPQLVPAPFTLLVDPSAAASVPAIVSASVSPTTSIAVVAAVSVVTLTPTAPSTGTDSAATTGVGRVVAAHVGAPPQTLRLLARALRPERRLLGVRQRGGRRGRRGGRGGCGGGCAHVHVLRGLIDEGAAARPDVEVH